MLQGAALLSSGNSKAARLQLSAILRLCCLSYSDSSLLMRLDSQYPNQTFQIVYRSKRSPFSEVAAGAASSTSSVSAGESTRLGGWHPPQTPPGSPPLSRPPSPPQASPFTRSIKVECRWEFFAERNGFPLFRRPLEAGSYKICGRYCSGGLGADLQEEGSRVLQ